MTCNLCGVNEATIHLTEIVNSQMLEIHLCETCAKEKGTDFKTHFNMGDLFADLSGLTVGGGKKEEHKLSAACSNCGMTYEQFGKTGRMGCPTCYEAFAKFLLPLIKRVQRTTHHVGKKPSKISGPKRTTHDLRLLQDRLRKSVQSEAFEEAAAIRDQIKKLEDKMKKEKKKGSS